jgi:hypothetical protein
VLFMSRLILHLSGQGQPMVYLFNTTTEARVCHSCMTFTAYSNTPKNKSVPREYSLQNSTGIG